MDKPGDVYSKRAVPMPDVFQHEDLPLDLRYQITHLLRDAIGPRFGGMTPARQLRGETVWDEIERRVAREHGLWALPPYPARLSVSQPPYNRCLCYVWTALVPKALDMVEIAFGILDTEVRASEGHEASRDDAPLMRADDAVTELNHRFREHGCGFQFDSGRIIRVGSPYLHDVAVRPALTLLHDPVFEGPEKKFLEAHRALREGRHDDTVILASEALARTLATILVARGHPNARDWPIREVVEEAVRQGLVPGDRLTGMLPFRDVVGGPGAPPIPRTLVEEDATFALHQAATYIVYAVGRAKATVTGS